MNIRNALLIVVLLLGTSLSDGAGNRHSSRDCPGESRPASDSHASLDLLRGVVHFSDDDVRFRTASGLMVFVDPVSWPTDDAVVGSGMVKPDLILITHSHVDHFQPTIIREYLNLNPGAIVAGPPDVVKTARAKGMDVREIGPGHDYTFAGVSFRTVPACFLEGASHPRANRWVGYLLHLDGADYYLTGDTQPLSEMADLHVDVLFPLLSGCGGNMAQALKMCELTRARLVVPVHNMGHEEVIKRFLGGLPKGVQGAWYKDTRLTAGPATDAKENARPVAGKTERAAQRD